MEPAVYLILCRTTRHTSKTQRQDDLTLEIRDIEEFCGARDRRPSSAGSFVKSCRLTERMGSGQPSICQTVQKAGSCSAWDASC